MDEKIPCTTNERKVTKNEWGNADTNFLRALYSVYQIKYWTILFPS